MSLSETLSEPSRERGDGASSSGIGEARSWLTGEAFQNFARAPTAVLSLPGGTRITLATDRVRAKPALTPTLSGALGQNAIGLGVWGTFFPKSVNRFLGMDAHPAVIQTACGLREFYTGFSLVGDPTRTDVLWTRVAGDVFDLAVLSRLNRADNPKRGNVRIALGVVAAVTALDLLAAVRMSTVKRTCD